jgi:hypothetical protein
LFPPHTNKYQTSTCLYVVATRIIDTIAMSTRRSTPLAEDSLGLRPHHPVPGVDKVPCADAATQLGTTSQTVRSLIERGDLDGYWQRVGQIYLFWAYRPAIEDFVASFGQFPEAQKTLGARRRSRRSLGNDRRGPASAPDTSKLQLRILGLQETVRCQSVVIEKLQQAMSQQEAVSNFLRQAGDAASRAGELVREANEEYRRLVSLEGVPDDASSVGGIT